MKSTVKQMELILKEMQSVKNDLATKEPLKETWIDGVEVQSSLHISERTLYRHRKSGRLPYSRVKGKIYYKKSDIKDLLEKNYRIEKPKCSCC